MAGISTVACTFGSTVGWQTQLNQTGGTPNINTNTLSISQAYTTGAANIAAGGADEVLSFITTITAGSGATIDLTSATNVAGQTAVAMARIKGWIIQLLSVAQDSTNGTACSGVTVGNTGAAITNAQEFGFAGGGSGLTINVTAAAGAITVVAIAAAGSGYPPSSIFLACVVQSTATQGLVAVTTNSSGVPTAVALVNAGASYTTATPLATFVLGFYKIRAGGVLEYFDNDATGYTVDSTHKNVRIVNNDAAVAAAVKFTAVGGQS